MLNLNSLPASDRRVWLRGMAGWGLASMGCASLPVVAAPRAVEAASAAMPTRVGTRVTQLLDMRDSQQELSRDYATGLRLAFAQASPGQAQLPQLVTLELDGSAAATAQALASVAADPTQIALVGTAGDALAAQVMAHVQRANIPLAHLGPWLLDSHADDDARLLTFLASREQQLQHALRSLAGSGVAELGFVYTDRAEAKAMEAHTHPLAQRLNIRARHLTPAPGQAMQDFAGRLPADSPFHLVFMGSSVALAQCVGGLGARAQVCIVVCVSGVDPSLFVQLVPENRVPVVFTQGVPHPQSSRVPLVRAYRQALARYFDEAPSAVSLAGYVAGLYAVQLLGRLGAAPTREQVLAEVQRRRSVTLEQWPLRFSGSGRGSDYVAQVLLNSRGQLISA